VVGRVIHPVGCGVRLQVGSLLKVLSLLAAASIKDVHPSHVFGPHPTWALAATSASGMYRSRSGNSGSRKVGR
jgi:hypothetical protein